MKQAAIRSPRRAIAAATALLLSLCALAARAADEESRPIEKLKPMFLTTKLAEGGKPAAVIAAPEGYKAQAEELARALESACGVKLPVMNDLDALKDFGKRGHVIALGQYGNNKLIERLYFHWYAIVDGSQPGAGGMLLQSVHNPEGIGVNVIIAGGSDDAGVARAAIRLAEVAKSSGGMLAYLNEVDLGQGGELVQARVKEVLDPARVWPTIHPMEAQQAIAEAAILFQYTGQEPLAQAYKQHLLEWLDDREHQFAASDDFWRMIIAWDLMEESPVFDDDERLAIANKLLDVMQRETREYPTGSRVPNYNISSFRQAKELNRIRQNHPCRYANTLFFGGRYFDKYYRLREARQWMQDARQFFRPQMKSHIVLEGSVTHIALITLTEAATYAFADDAQAFMSADVLGRIADRGLLWLREGQSLSDSETPYLFWCAAAHLLNRPYYLRPIQAADAQMSQLRLPWRNRWELGRSFWDGAQPTAADRPPQWAQCMPLTASYIEQCDAHGPKNVPANKSFEFAAFAPPESIAKEHLVLAGHSTGSYSLEAANSISEYWSHGLRWLVGVGRVATVQKQTSLAVVRDGKTEALPAFASMEHIESNDGWAASRSLLRNHNGTNWYRNIVQVPGQWMLVIDEVRASVGGDYLLETRWVTPVRTALDAADAVLVAPAAKPEDRLLMRLSGTGFDRQYIAPWLYLDYLAEPLTPKPLDHLSGLSEGAWPEHISIIARRWTGRLKEGESHTFATLSTVSRIDARAPHRLVRQSDDEYVIAGEKQSWRVRVDRDGEISVADVPAQSAPTTVQSEPERKGPTPESLKPAWAVQQSARVLSSAPLSDSGRQLWAIGTIDGHIRVFDDSGTLSTSIDMPGQVLCLLGMDLNGDGRDELLAGGDIGGIRAFTAKGAQLWEYRPPEWKPNSSWRQSMGTQRPVITDLMPIRDKSGEKILASGLYFYILDKEGRLLCTYDNDRELSFTDLVGVKAQGIGRTPENTLRMTAGDVDGDGAQDIIGDINDSGYTFIRAWSQDGNRIGGYQRPRDRFMGSSIRNVISADFDQDGKDEIVVGADAYLEHLSFYQAPEGLVWSRGIGGSIEALLPADVNNDGRPEIVCGTELGQVHVYGSDGKRLLLADAGSAITSIAAAGARPPHFWISTVDGRLIAMDASGQVQSETKLGGYLDRIVTNRAGDRVLVTSADGLVALFTPGP